jgi:hypothetical protein
MNLSRESLPDRCPGQRSWHYDRAEIIADGVVHAIGVCLPEKARVIDTSGGAFAVAAEQVTS